VLQLRGGANDADALLRKLRRNVLDLVADFRHVAHGVGLLRGLPCTNTASHCSHGRTDRAADSGSGRVPGKKTEACTGAGHAERTAEDPGYALATECRGYSFATSSRNIGELANLAGFLRIVSEIVKRRRRELHRRAHFGKRFA
jgi:hypothetical protein